MRGLALEQTKTLRKFDEVRDVVAQQHALKNPDLVVDMGALRVTPALDLEIPKVGTFRMTDWAQRQLGSALGVQWNKWFDPKLVNHEQVQEELQRRFSKTGDKRKIRTNQFKPGSPGVPSCDG